MESNSFDFPRFMEESKQALINPQEYFSSFRPEGNLGIPVIKALIYGAVAGVLNFIWIIFNISITGMFGGTAGAIGAILGSVIGAMIGLFLGAVIILLLVAIAAGRTDFQPIVHVSGALLVIMPISALVNVFSGIHFMFGSLLSLVVNLYALWMLYHAMTGTLNAKAETSKIIMYVLGGLLVLFFFIGLATRRVTRNIRDWDRFDMDFGQRNITPSDAGPGKGTHADFHSVYSRLNT